MRAPLTVFLLASLAGCSESASPPPYEEGQLRLLPAGAEIETALEVPADTPYSLERYTAGAWVDLTAETTFTADVEVGSVFVGNILTITGRRAGRGEVHATLADGTELSTPVAVRLITYERGMAVTDPARRWLSGNITDEEDLLAYPEDSALVPPNSYGLPLRWLSGPYRFFRLEVFTDLIRSTFDLYCDDSRCQVVLPDALLDAFYVTHGGGAEILWSVTAVSEDGAQSAYSPLRLVLLATDPVQGALYYWQAEPARILRKDVGSVAPPEEWYGDGARCVGCHFVSRSGERVAVGINEPIPSRLDVVQVTDDAIVRSTAANFGSFSPDETQLVRTDYDGLVIEELATGAVTPLVAQGTMPDWSPRGDTIVYVEASSFPPPIPGLPPVEAMHFNDGRLMRVDWDGSQWGAPVPFLSEPGAHDYYPSFSPDGGWIVFNRSAGNHDSYEARDARLFMARLGGSIVVDLARANGVGSLVNSWPKLTPFVDEHRTHRLIWVTFSSYRSPWGVAMAPKAQLWMAAIDLDIAESGADSSWPAFWLPFQDESKGNHIGQWAEQFVEKQ